MEIDQNSITERRPVFLSVLCVLSYVWIGISALGPLVSLITGPQSEEQMLEGKAALYQSATQMKEQHMDGFARVMRQLADMSEVLNNNHYLVQLVTLIVLGVGLFGVIQMWKQKKIGFHLYIVYSLLGSAQIYFFVKPELVPTFMIVFNLILSGLFVLLYGLNLKHLK